MPARGKLLPLILGVTRAAIVMCAIVNNLASAQSDSTSRTSDSLPQLDRVVVTATRTAHRASEVPASVTIIGRDEIAAAPARNVGDLLQAKVGVLPRRTIGMAEGVPSDINFRGVPTALAASRVLILVDGIPTNVSGTSLLLANEIPLEAVERVEIIRGPFSSLYGANAYGGVINIITRESDGKPQTELSGGGGSFGYWHLEGWSGGGSRLSYSLAAGTRSIGSYFGSDSILVRNGRLTGHKAADNYGFGGLRVFGKARLQVTPTIATRLHVRYYGSDLGFGRTKRDTLTPGDSVPGYVNVMGTKFLIGPEATWTPSPDVQVKLWGFYRYVLGEFEDEDIAYFDTSSGSAVPRYEESDWKVRSNDGQIQAQATAKAGPHNTLTAGIEVLRNQIDYGPKRNLETGEVFLTSRDTIVAILNGGVSLQDEVRLWDRRLLIVPGLRLDFHSQFGSALSPRLASSVKLLPDLTVRASFGRGFRAPALSELCMPPFRINADAQLISNPDLKPEYIWAVDGGVEQRVLDAVVVRVNGFYNRMEDLISPLIVSQYIYGNKEVSFRNISRAWSAGTEIESEAQLLRALWITASYTYMETRDESYQVPLDYAPRHKVGGGLRWLVTRGRWEASGMVSGTSVGDRKYMEWSAPVDQWHLNATTISSSTPPMIELDNYAFADVACRISYRNRFWVGGDVLNITNAVFQESGSTLAPGRLISASIGVKF